MEYWPQLRTRTFYEVHELMVPPINNLDKKTTPIDAVRDKLVHNHLNLVNAIASRLCNRIPAGFTRDDLVSCGVLGLMDAAKRFDLENSEMDQFPAYASIRIRGAMIDSLRQHDLVPRSARRAAKQIDKAMNKLRSELGRDPSDDEMAAEIGIDLDGYLRMYESARAAPLFEQRLPLFREDGEEIVANKKEPDALENFSRDQVAKILLETIDTLPDSMRTVLTLYYYDELNYSEIAEVLGVTVSRISQIHSGAMSKMRQRLKPHELVETPTKLPSTQETETVPQSPRIIGPPSTGPPYSNAVDSMDLSTK